MVLQYPLLTIDLAALRQNLLEIRSTLPEHTMLMAVVKADAYGHGIVQVARNALSAGASWLAVARTDEGVVLRQAGIEAPVLVLGAPSDKEIADGVRYGLTLAATDTLMLNVIQQQAELTGKKGYIHLKIDTGMGRIGVRTSEEIQAMLDALEKCPLVQMTGVFTHFADADGSDSEYTFRQLERFRELTSLLPAGIIRHCANSAAIHRYPEAAMDMVRAGISMYGYPPVETGLPLQPVLEWKTCITFVKEIRPGDKVSYGCTFTADKPVKLATIACGYGDGYHRCASGKAEVIIHGKRCPVVGRICMDQMMVDVTELKDVNPGDTVFLIGRSGDAVISAEDLARWSGTISYEVLLAATQRVHRSWINDENE